MSLGKKIRNPRVKFAPKVKMLFGAMAAMSALVEKGKNAGHTTLALFRGAYQKAVNAAAQNEKPPRPILKDDGTGNKVEAFPVSDQTAKAVISTVLEKWSADKRYIPPVYKVDDKGNVTTEILRPAPSNVDKWGNVKIYTEGEGENLSTYYLDSDGKGGLKRVPLPEDAKSAQFPREITDETISGFRPGERVKQDVDAMFNEALEMDFDADALLAEYGIETEE